MAHDPVITAHITISIITFCVTHGRIQGPWPDWPPASATGGFTRALEHNIICGLQVPMTRKQIPMNISCFVYLWQFSQKAFQSSHVPVTSKILVSFKVANRISRDISGNLFNIHRKKSTQYSVRASNNLLRRFVHNIFRQQCAISHYTSILFWCTFWNCTLNYIKS